MIMNDKLERMWREMAMDYVKVLSHNVCCWPDENNDKSQYSQLLGQELKWDIANAINT
jgi:hypothetical protein